jgi:hypothetical protein
METRTTYLVADEFFACVVGQEPPYVARNMPRASERHADLAAFEDKNVVFPFGEATRETRTRRTRTDDDDITHI